MKPRQFTNGNIDTQLKMISSRKKTKQNQILFRINALQIIGGFVPFFYFVSQTKTGKNACSADLHMVFIREVGFVWRQLELAFFGAVTPVAALF